MSIFEKIQNARVLLQSKPLKKTGKNTFAKYDYFELEDFLPTVQVIFKEVGLCGILTFTTDLATLTVYDVSTDASIAFQAPMASAELKGCHNIQNTGAVISYMRRYLWMLALEIVEHDALDATTGKKQDTQQQELNQYRQSLESVTSMSELVNAWQVIPKPLQAKLSKVKDDMKAKLQGAE